MNISRVYCSSGRLEKSLKTETICAVWDVTSLTNAPITATSEQCIGLQLFSNIDHILLSSKFHDDNILKRFESYIVLTDRHTNIHYTENIPPRVATLRWAGGNHSAANTRSTTVTERYK